MKQVLTVSLGLAAVVTVFVSCGSNPAPWGEGSAAPSETPTGSVESRPEEGPAETGPVAIPELTAPLPYRTESNDGTYFVVYRPHPDPIPLNEPFDLEVQVFRDSAGREPANDVSLQVDAAMPQHKHGMNRQPTVETLGTGRFAGRGLLFHMPGYWELYFDITHGAVTERAQFEIQLE